MRKLITLAICTAVLAGCSNIGTVNGVPVNKKARAEKMGEGHYCAQNPAVCIVGGVVAVGVLKHLIDKGNDDVGGEKPCNSCIPGDV
ncbi:MAG: hypothetical protein CSA70_12155 [Rhodobacterales bacterium]|nr:MAG: hypothetical protein CR993_01060 [Rhodobacterales bacterium]PIE10087.1 MAG: hypothetical protein CSA70_12155 [Rhodobacterales bacterium]